MDAGRRIGAVCLALVIMLGLAAPTEAGHKKRHGTSQIVLESANADAVSGNVSSPRSGCLGDRTVTVYRQESWTSVPTSSVYRRVKTRSDGSWTLPGPIDYGQYYAVVEEKRAPRLVCWQDQTDESKVY